MTAFNTMHVKTAVYDACVKINRLIACSRTLTVDLADDFPDRSGVRGVAQHVQDSVDVVACDFSLFLRVERVKRLP